MSKTFRRNKYGNDNQPSRGWKYKDSAPSEFRKKFRQKLRTAQNRELRNTGEVETVEKRCVDFYWY